MGDVVVDRLAASVRSLPDAGRDDARLERIRALEELSSAVAAAKAEITATFVGSQRREQRAAGVRRELIDRRTTARIAAARRLSPNAAGKYVGWAMILTTELPATLAMLKSGRTSEWRAMLVARETAWLSREHRAVVDADVASRMEHLGDRRVEAETRKLAYALDPAGAAARTAAAESERRVTLRPAPDAMTRLSALLPTVGGVAAYATLCRDADALVGTGQSGGRTRGQVMADLLVARITGQQFAAEIPVEVELVIPADSLLGESDEPATVIGAGPIPAEQARRLIREAGEETPMWIRRLYRSPKTDELVAMESRGRYFTPAQRKYVRLRSDGICTTPWCDAPVRHADHVQPHTAGGPTHLDNANGLCAACNYTKNASENQSHAPPEAPAA